MNRKERRRAHAHSRAAPQQAPDPSIERDFREAIRCLQAGELTLSERAHRRVLERQPQHAPSLHHLGLIALKRSARNEAVDYIRQSVAIDPDYHQAWLNLAVILGELQRSNEAIDACRRSLAVQPQNFEAHAVLGDLLRVARHDNDAMQAYVASLRLKPEQPKTLVRLGELTLQSGSTAEALAYCRRALEIEPGSSDAQSLQRKILAASAPIVAADAALQSESLSPAEHARSLNELGTFLRGQRRHEEAIDVYRRASEADPERPEPLFNMALAYEELGRKDEALASYQAGLAIDPERADAYANVGTLLRGMNMHNGAVQAFEHAIKLDPTLATAHYNLAVTLKQRERYDEARSAFSKSVEHAPDSIVNRFELANMRRILCDWDGIDDEERDCLELFRARTTVIAPFQLISIASTRADQLEAGRRYSKTFAVPEPMRFKVYQNGHGQDHRIRVGFLSSDLFEHATAMLLVEVLEHIDRQRFETFAYCFSPDDGTLLRRRIIAAFDHHNDIRKISDKEAAHAIHADGIDILIDLKGYTKDTRSGILAYRPAPIQVNYLGYPATMGADFIDYILADAVVAPMEHQPHYAEKIVHLPTCYQPNDRKRKISDEPVARSDFGLPDDAFVFCSFNNSYKLNARLFDVWMRLLGNVPGSVLWLLVPHKLCHESLRREAEARGIDPGRLVFASRLPIPKHLARHRLADLFIDALPCNAHTTTSDALWAGLPVLTCIGETFSGRVAASLLNAMNLPELITGSLEDYERTALALARDKERLARIRTKIAEQRMTAPLFDSERYARNLGRSFETMVDIMKSAAEPRPFVVREIAPRSTPVAGPVTPLRSGIGLRTLYDKCPLCEAVDMPYRIEAKITALPHHPPGLPPTIKWRACAGCAHVFAEGYFAPDAYGAVVAAGRAGQKIGIDAENNRKISARLVERIARYVPEGDWLDIGASNGNGSLLFTAAEWGFAAVAAGLRSDSATKLRDLGFETYAQDLEDIDAAGRFSVVSLDAVLEGAPFPGRLLAAAHRLMRRGGALFIATPNMDSIVWRALDATGANPYWGDPERYHNFTRARLVALLDAHGFKSADYNIGERHRSGMEIIALRA